MRPSRIRVLRVTEQAVLGGEQLHILYLLAGLDPSRFEQVACSEREGPFVDRVRELGIRHIPVAMRSKFDLAAARQLAGIIRAGDYDIVHLHGARAGLLGRLAARLAGTPLIVWTMHVFQPDVLQGPRRWKVPLYCFTEAILARFFCDHIVTISNDLRARALAWERIPPDKVTTIYSGIDLAPFEQAHDGDTVRHELGLPPDIPVVCTIGRLCVQKGVDDMLRAAALVHRQVPSARFLIVGDGPMRAELEELAAALDLDSCVSFLGFRPDTARLLAASDVFATATLWEGLGKVNVEAMAAGKPVVATRVGPVPEVLDGYRGAVLVPPRDPDALANALLAMLRKLPEYARWGASGRALAHSMFDRQTMVGRTAALYESLIVGWERRHSGDHLGLQLE